MRRFEEWCGLTGYVFKIKGEQMRNFKVVALLIFYWGVLFFSFAKKKKGGLEWRLVDGL